ncbi:hypothetical protein K437DRAFT_254815 [Tilletiaria anomala UBC 951]|uniref:Rpr2-domain-containing protein n=1 Tax=Tilletiaria anomala (strain ATCC 24038 / CBS 436.72 / UBC 951) TaxID=1037660 RepID=A0A066WCE9_TILAU|nr:uncharacterized protein K437DRAFT_254815 [Tilletiaria anomala UBC 951]KDN51406.1 hypothetical protein K437DRAFT_254815 [Tilletiaria anomala UBC 951]
MESETASALHLDALSKVHSVSLPELASIEAKRLVRYLESHFQAGPSSDHPSTATSFVPRRGLWAEKNASPAAAAAASAAPQPAFVRGARRAPTGVRLNRLLPQWHSLHNTRCRKCAIAMVPGVNTTLEAVTTDLDETQGVVEPRAESRANSLSGRMRSRRAGHLALCLHCGARRIPPKPAKRRAVRKRIEGSVVEPRFARFSQPNHPTANTPQSSPNKVSEGKHQPMPTDQQPAQARISENRPMTLDEKAAHIRAEKKRLLKAAAIIPAGTFTAGPSKLPTLPQAQHTPSILLAASAVNSTSPVAAMQGTPAAPSVMLTTPATLSPDPVSTVAGAGVIAPTTAQAIARPMTLDERAALAKAEKRRQRKEQKAKDTKDTAGPISTEAGRDSSGTAAAPKDSSGTQERRDMTDLMALLAANKARKEKVSSARSENTGPVGGLRSFFG